MKQTGKEVGRDITDAFKSGALDLIGGFADMLNGIMAAVDAVIRNIKHHT